MGGWGSDVGEMGDVGGEGDVGEMGDVGGEGDVGGVVVMWEGWW